MFVVEGLDGGRTALIAKVHHAILDGVSGASILAAFLDLSPRARIVDAPHEPWDPAPLPGSAQMLRYAASSLSHQPARVLTTLDAGVEAIADLGTHNRTLRGRGESSPPAFFSAPRTSINGAVSNRKRFSSLSVPLDDAKLVRHVFGGTVNDVLLAGVAGGLRRLLSARGESVGRALVAMVPVSTRPDGGVDGGALGNQLSALLVSLATDIDDPVQRLGAIARSTRAAKEQEQLHRGRLVGDVAQIAAPGLVSRVARAVAGTRLFDRVRPPFNVMVSGIKGPDFPLFCAGSRVEAMYPVGPIAEGVGLNVTVFSYLDQLQFGLLACRKLLPELDDLAVSIDDALGELVGCALDAQGATG
jgi:WS/DGAT/MGAT family acyltransferase